MSSASMQASSPGPAVRAPTLTCTAAIPAPPPAPTTARSGACGRERDDVVLDLPEARARPSATAAVRFFYQVREADVRSLGVPPRRLGAGPNAF
nr:unnamed protein product [Digitaria exilis]CAB3479595.1 unnamed protein product [Digitaria exilis]